jgi:molybdate transport system substrate-binding protein
MRYKQGFQRKERPVSRLMVQWPKPGRPTGAVFGTLGAFGAFSLVLAAAVLLALLPGARQAYAQTPGADNRPSLVAAAANLQPVLGELVPLFERQQAGRITLNTGSSANLVRQIQQGLPAELFLSADEDFALRLFDAGLTLDRGVVYATGRIALIVPADSPLALDAQLKGLAAGLSSVNKFAIANPELAPYGKAAVQALQKLGLWPALQSKVVLGESIAQTTQYVSTGAAQAGITALSMALAPELARRVRYVVIADDLHAPVRQRMVLLKSARPAARAFYEFLQSPAARAVMKRYGYV